MIGVVLYGSVARGEADRRSDIDLWMLVGEDRMANQRVANRVKQALQEEAFENGRYEYEIDAEALQAIAKYISRIRDVLSDELVVYETEAFQTIRNMVFRGDLS